MHVLMKIKQTLLFTNVIHGIIHESFDPEMNTVFFLCIESKVLYFWIMYCKKLYVYERSTYTVADYRQVTVRLQLKTLLPCILLLTFAIKVQLRSFTIEITGKSLDTVQKTVISIVDYLYFWGQIL